MKSPPVRENEHRVLERYWNALVEKMIDERMTVARIGDHLKTSLRDPSPKQRFLIEACCNSRLTVRDVVEIVCNPLQWTLSRESIADVDWLVPEVFDRKERVLFYFNLGKRWCRRRGSVPTFASDCNVRKWLVLMGYDWWCHRFAQTMRCRLKFWLGNKL